MSDLIREVDEELKAERALKLWRRYGKYVVAVAILVVAVTGGAVFWKDQRQKARLAESEKYSEGMSLAFEGKAIEAAAVFAALAKDAGPGYGALARLHEAALKSRSGDDAVAAYDAIAKNSNLSSDFKDLGTILSVMHSLDTIDPAEAAKRLDPLAKDNKNWRFSAKEMLAVLALKQNDAERAKALYKSLADDPNSPPALRARATEMLAAMGG
ncbi:MAG: tetratricopeptide repeat protein [Alphaproteobacteria bacterium]